MKKETISNAVTNISSEYIEKALDYAVVKTRKKVSWYKWVATAACFAIAIIVAIPFISNLNIDNAGFWGNGNATLLDSHRSDFSPKIDESILHQFENNKDVKKAYLLCTNDWFLSDELLDFSQVVSNDVVYIIPGGEHGENTDTSYSLYNVNDKNEIEWIGTSSSSNEVNLPYGFVGLTYDVIKNSLVGIEYEDYIITYSQRLYTVFVWVRGETEDVIITYPTRPDILGLKNGGIYKINELKNILKESYTKSPIK